MSLKADSGLVLLSENRQVWSAPPPHPDEYWCFPVVHKSVFTIENIQSFLIDLSRDHENVVEWMFYEVGIIHAPNPKHFVDIEIEFTFVRDVVVIYHQTQLVWEM